MSEIPMAPDPRVEQQDPPARTGILRRRAPAVGLVVAGLVAGALGVGVLGHTATGTTGSNAAAGQHARPGGFGPGGGVAGETRVSGTITVVGSSGITVRQADGTTATYAVNGTTDVRRDGAQSSLSGLKVDDHVLVHVVPSAGGGTVAERILAGTSATPGGPGGAVRPGV